MGVPQEFIDQAEQAIAARNERATFGVWPEHWHAVQLMEAMHTQWRTQASPGGLLWVSMDYAALPAVMDGIRRRIPRRMRRPRAVLLDQLQVLELVLIEKRNSR